MSPEQVSSRPVDARTDLWSLGVVLYEMLTGVRPFAGDHAGAILYAILHESPTPISTLRPELPPSVDAIVERLLTKESTRRYDDAEQLIADLAPLSPATDAAARPIRPRRRWSRRVAWYGAALIAVGAVIASWRGAPPRAVSDRRLAAEDLTAQGKRDVLFRSEDGRRQSLELFRKAIAVDSTYAAAHSSLSHLLVMTAEDGHGSRRAHFAQAEKAARTAISLDSSLADAHAALGHVLLIDYQAAKAEAQFKRALELNPVEPYVREFLVWLYIFTNRPRDALEQAERAAKDSPNSPTAIAEVARALIVNGRCNEALELLGRLAYLQPPPARAASIAAQCYAQRGMWQKAIDELRPVAARNPVQAEPWLGFMLARAGATKEAHQIRDSLLARAQRSEGGAYGMAVIYTGFREFDNAFEWLHRSIDERSLRYNIMEPAFEELRRDPRFDRVRARLGIEKQ
jgi:tetratricopeptide (TPR) repeat protein